ncbi:MAG: STAS domain-containing protein [Pseudomonadota bacterium]
MDLHFKPKPGGFKDNILRVAPDLLPPRSIKIDSVYVNGEAYKDFDAEKLTVKIPPSTEPVSIKVRIVPTEGLDHFTAKLDQKGETATLTVVGDLDGRALPVFRTALEKIMQSRPNKVVLKVKDLNSMTSAAARALILAKQKLDLDEDVQIAGASRAVKTLLEQDEFAESVTFVDDAK